ncbi:tetratricopeptide repeat protein [Calothrix membranacea FACHB-236]|nr:tetratricopeptide repeat protein [Calothrix membranacea FACHB-236]
MPFQRVQLITLATFLTTFAIGNGLVSFCVAQEQVLKEQLAVNRQVLAQTPNPSKAKAEKFFEQGNKQLETSQFPDALQSFQQALNIYRAIGDNTRVAETLNKLGEVYTRLSQYQKAQESLQSALTIFRNQKHRLGEALALNHLGEVNRHQGETQTALKYHEQALAIIRELGNRAEEAASLHDIAAVYETQGKYENALKFYEQALLMRREVKDRAGEALTLIGLGNTYLSYIQLKLYYQAIKKPEEIKSYNDVLKYYQQALAIMGSVGNRGGVGWSLNGIGMSYGALNKQEEALKFYEQALVKMREVGNHSGEAAVIFNLGKDYNWGFDPQRESRPISLDLYEQALAITREISDRPLQAKILYRMGFVYNNKGRKRPETALEYYKQALPIARQIGDRFLEEKILDSIGSIYSSLGYPQTAQEYQEQALTIRQEMGMGVNFPTEIVKVATLVTYSTPKKRPTLITLLDGEALIHYRNGEAHANNRRYQAALESYQQALAIVRQQQNRPWEWVILNQMGTIYETLAQFPAALDSYKQSLAIRREVDERAAKQPIPHTIRVAYGTDVNFQNPEGMGLEEGITKGVIKIGEGEPITTPITTLANNSSGITIQENKVTGAIATTFTTFGQKKLEVIAGLPGWAGFTENEEEDTLANMGDIYAALGQHQAALNSYSEALNMIRAEMESQESKESRWRRLTIEGTYYQQEQRIKRSIGEVYAALGQHQAALQAYQESLAIANKENSGNRIASQIPILLTQIGKAYENLGQYPAALQAYQQALAIARDPKNQGYYFSEEYLIRRYGQEEYFRRFRIAYAKPNPEALLNSIGTIYEKLGQPQAAQEHRQQAVAFKQEISNRSEEEITGKKAILITEVGKDETKKPIVQINRLEGEAVVLFAAGNSYTSQGEYLKQQYQFALQSYQQALAIVRQQKNSPWEAVILTQMGLVYEKSGQNQAALESYQQGLAIKQEIEKLTDNKATLLSKLPLSGAVNYESVKIRFDSGQITTFKPEGGVIFFAQTREKIKADQIFKEGRGQSRDKKYARAIKTLETALSVYQQLEDKAGIAKTFYEIGQVYDRQKDDRQALEYYQQALSIYREIGDKSGEKSSLNFMGRIYYQQGSQFSQQGQYQAALENFRQVLEIAKKLGHQETVWKTLNQMAIIYSSLGEYKLALDYYQQALPIRYEILGHWVGVEFNMGRIYEVLGQYELALKSYQEALKTARKPVLLEIDGNRIGDIAGEARAINAIGNIHSRQGKYELALDLHRQALTVIKKVDDQKEQKNLEGTTLYSIGLVYFKQGKYQLALDFLQSALAIYQQFNARYSEGVTLHAIGKVYFEQGEYQLAWNFLQQSLVIAQSIGNKEGEGEILNTIGYLLEKQNQPELAIIFFKQSVNAREAIRQNIRELSKEQQQSYTEIIAQDYRHLADILLQQNRVLEAQRVLDLLKVQEIEDYLRNVRGSDNTATGIAERPQEQQIRQGMTTEIDQAIALGKELAQLESIPVTKRTPAQTQRIIALRKTQQEIAKQFNAFLESPKVREWIGQLQQTTQGQGFNLESSATALQDNLKKLQQDAAIIYPLVLSDRLELILVTPYAPPLRRTVAVKQAELNRAIAEFRSALPKRTPGVKVPAQQLYNWLIKPLENDLAQAKTKTIIYAPDGQLRYIPLAALYDGQQWLVERFSINNITAVSLTDLNTKPQNQLNVLAAAFTQGNYSFEVGTRRFKFSGLPFAGVEVENLALTVPRTKKLLDEQFNQDIVLQMNDYSVVHLATHAAFTNGQPEESFILFGNGDRATLRDIQNWRLPNVDLVVLSACETGLGDRLGDGREILGFGYQMQQTGARAAIASLWSVDDGGTQALMNAFYTKIAQGKITKAEALRQAQIALITGNYATIGQQRGINDNLSPQVRHHLSHPFYWAPFILIGNGL